MKNRISLLLFACAIILISGCATTITREQMIQETADFQRPLPNNYSSDQGILYIVRPSPEGSFVRFNVFADDPTEVTREAGYTRGSQHIYLQLPAGNHRIYSKAENTADLPLTIEANKAYYIQQVPTMGLFLARNELVELDSVEGKYFLKKTTIGTLNNSFSAIPSDSIQMDSTLPTVKNGELQGFKKLVIDSIHNEGNEFRFGFEFGSVNGGGQLDLATKALSPTPDGLSRSGFGFRFVHWEENFGFNGDFVYTVSEATKAQYKPLSLYNQKLIRLGALYSPYYKSTRDGLHRIYANGGINYDILTFNSDANTGITDVATGLGFFGLAGYDYVTSMQLLFGFTLGYENKNPIIKNAKSALSSDEVIFGLHFGYKFNR